MGGRIHLSFIGRCVPGPAGYRLYIEPSASLRFVPGRAVTTTVRLVTGTVDGRSWQPVRFGRPTDRTDCQLQISMSWPGRARFRSRQLTETESRSDPNDHIRNLNIVK
jgi:hypothetical protein